MRRIILFVLLALSYKASSQFRVQFSEPLAVFEFVRNITASAGSNVYKDVFDSSRYNNDKYRSLLKAFESVNYFYWYEYPQYPYGNKIGGNTYFLLNKDLIESESIEQFKSRALGVIPNADLSILYQTLSAFLPVYRELILKPNKKGLMVQIDKMRKKIRETDIAGLTNKVKKFHNSTWDVNTPFIMNICPTKPSNSIHATAFFNYAYANLPSNTVDINLILTFMFHESFHIIYDEQSLAFKNEFSCWFKANTSIYAKYAELLFNEAVTTALTSGYLYHVLTKTMMPKQKWYNEKYISSMAYELYPITEDYLNRSKQVDKHFIDEYIRLYETKFPEWISNIENIIADRFIVCEDKKVYAEVIARFPHRSIREYASELNFLSLEKMKSIPITKIVILPKADVNKNIKMLRQVFPELAEWSPAPGDFGYAKFMDDKTFLIIVHPVTKTAQAILEEIKLDPG